MTDDENDDLSPNVFNKKKQKKKKGQRGQWPEALVNDLVDVILENEKFKEKLLLTNVKNVKNSHSYVEVFQEIKERCNDP